jgi:hypothetical protein
LELRLHGNKLEAGRIAEMMRKLTWPLRKKGLEESFVRLERVKTSATNALVQGSVWVLKFIYRFAETDLSSISD